MLMKSLNLLIHFVGKSSDVFLIGSWDQLLLFLMFIPLPCLTSHKTVLTYSDYKASHR